MQRFTVVAASLALLLTIVVFQSLNTGVHVTGGAGMAAFDQVLVIPAAPQRASGVAVESQLVVEGCNAYPFSYYFADFVVVSGIIRNSTGYGVANPKVTITFHDNNGQTVATWNTNGLSTFVGSGASMGFRVQHTLGESPGSYASMTCVASGEVSSLQPFPISVENVTVSSSGARTLGATVRSIIPVQGWAMLGVARDSNGRIVASAVEVRGDTLGSGGTNVSLALDRDIGEPASVELVVSSGSQPPATSTPAPPTATATAIVTPTATSTHSPTPTSTPTPLPTPGWTSVSTPLTTTLRSIALTSDNDGWAVGDGGAILQLKAGTWVTVTSPTSQTLRSISSSGDGYAIAVGDSSMVVSYTFTQFVTQQQWLGPTISPTLPSGRTFNAVTAVSPTLQFIGDNQGEIHRLGITNTTWLTMPQAITGLTSDSGSSFLATTSDGVTGRVYVVSTLNPTAQAVFTHTAPLRGISKIGNRVVVAGDSGTYFVADDPAGPYSAAGSLSTNFHGVAVSSSSNGWAVGDNGAIARIVSGTVSIDVPVTTTLRSASSRSPGVAWAVGNGGTAIRYLDSSFPTSTPTPVPTPIWQAPVTPVSGTDLHAISAISSTRIIAAGANGTILTSTNGITWTVNTSAVTETLRSIAAPISGTTYLAGDNNTMLTYHTNNSTWIALPTGVTTTTNLIGVSVFGNRGLALAAPNGANCCVVLSGTVWSLQPQTSTATYRAIALQDENTGWLVGDSGAVGRWSNGTLSVHPSPGNGHLYAVSIAPSGKAVAVGAGGRIITFNIDGPFPNLWVQEQSPVGVDLNAVVLVSETEGWAVGDSGTVLRLQDGLWKVASGFFPTSEDLRGVTALSNGSVWVVGDTGLIFYRQPNTPIVFKTQSLASGW